MKPNEFFLLMSAIYIAPNVSNQTRLVASAACIALSLIFFWIGEA